MTYTDAELEGALEDALLMDPRLSAQRVELSVTDGIVTLRGTVQTEDRKQVALAIAGQHPCCRGVVDQLRVVPPGDLPDDVVARNARMALGELARPARQNVSVSASNGVVALRGTVPTEWERAAAEDLVLGATGVRGVDSELIAVGASEAFDTPDRSP